MASGSFLRTHDSVLAAFIMRGILLLADNCREIPLPLVTKVWQDYWWYRLFATVILCCADLVKAMSRVSFAKIGLVAAGLMLAVETSFGCIVALGIGFEPVPLLLGIAFVLGFPVYLLGLRSLRGAAIGLWVLLLYRGAALCLVKPFQWINPFRDFNPLEAGWMSLLPYAAILFSASLWMLASVTGSARGSTLLSALQARTR